MEIDELEKRVNTYLNKKIPEIVSRALDKQDKVAMETCKATIRQFLQEQRLTLPGISLDQTERIMYENLIGYGPLTEFIDKAVERRITEIKVRGQNEIYTKEHGEWKFQPHARFRSWDHLSAIVNRILASSDKPLNESQAFVDNAELPDGSRVAMVRDPLTKSGLIMNIRIFTAGLYSPDALLKMRAVTEVQDQVLQFMVRARMNLLWVGGTDTGKTTAMGAYLTCHSPKTHIITIEDSNELQLKARHPELNVDDLFTKKDAVTHIDLFHLTLRMSPDLYIFNEIRTAPETAVLLSAQISGHPGSGSTVHAEDERRAMTRLTNNLREDDKTLAPEFAREKVSEAVDAFVIVRRIEGVRFISDIVEPIWNNDTKQIEYHKVFDRKTFEDTGCFNGFTPGFIDLARRRNSVGNAEIERWDHA